ncbi:MAG: hypothetical protein KAV40_01235 [Thermoplasmatales archaeon]|nr:hypothetical protein [Thermoplasmatales archaeon]
MYNVLNGRESRRLFKDSWEKAVDIDNDNSMLFAVIVRRHEFCRLDRVA